MRKSIINFSKKNSKSIGVILTFGIYCTFQIVNFATGFVQTSKVSAETNKPASASTSEYQRIDPPTVALTKESHTSTESFITTKIDSETYVPPKPAIVPVSDIEKMVLDMGGCDSLIRIMRCESGGNPNAYNRSSGASGLFQFLSGTWRRMGGSTAEAYQAPVQEQIAKAIALYRGGAGAGNWQCKG